MVVTAWGHTVHDGAGRQFTLLLVQNAAILIVADTAPVKVEVHATLLVTKEHSRAQTFDRSIFRRA